MTNEADLPGFNYLTKLFLDGALEELSSELELFLCADPSNLDGLNLLGLLEKKKGNVNEARKIFENLCERHPNSVGVLSNLGNLIAEQGNSTSAIAIFIKALALKPGKSQAEIIFKGLGLAQKSLGLDKEAIKSFKKGLRLRGPLNAELQLEIAHIYRKREDYYQAITAFDRIDIRASKIHQLECIYRIKDTTLFKEKLVALAGERKPNPLLGALISHSNVTLSASVANSFCHDPLSLIFKGALPKGKLTNSLISSLVQYSEEGVRNRKQQPLLIKGHQTNGNLLRSGRDFVVPVEALISASIKHYRKKFQDINEPFLKQWPKKFEIYAWLVNINSFGYLEPHIHKEGWLSGTIYLQVPDYHKDTEGGISFGLHGADLPRFNASFSEEAFSVSPREVVMFPSSLFHRTLEFTSGGKRISLAFDVIPRD